MQDDIKSACGITYMEINMWGFVIIWPVLTIVFVDMIVVKTARNQQLLTE
jgi:hypothetical protein